MTSPAGGVPANGACPSSLSSRRRVTAHVIGNSAATTASPCSGGGSSVSGPSSTPSGAVGEAGGLAAVVGSTATGQQLSRLLDKIYETIELNELRLLIQDHKDAVKLEWQQVTSVTLCQSPLSASITRVSNRFRILPFPIDCQTNGRPYNTLTLPCKRVIMTAEGK